MKKTFLFLVASWLLGECLWAQVTLKGQVTDLAGVPLHQAHVRCEELQIVTTTLSDGQFTLELPKSGTYTFQATFMGYRNAVKETTVRHTQSLTFKLEPDHLMTDEVVVTAIKASAHTPVAHSNLSKKYLQERQVADDIPYMLSLTPSAVSTSETGTGVGYTGLRIRGTDPTRINVTVNGIPLNDAESQGVFWVNMPDFGNSVEEVQIQRGVGTSTNGAAAFGATVNFRTQPYETLPSATLSSTAGSFNTFIQSAKISTGLMQNRFALDVRYSDLQSDGYVRHAFSDHHSLYISGAMVSTNSLLKASMIHGKQQTGISWNGATREELATDRRYNSAGVYTDENGETRYYENTTDNYTQTHYHLAYSRTLTARLNLQANAHYTFGEGFYEEYKENRKYSKYGWANNWVNGQEIDRTDAIQQKWMRNHFYGATLAANYQISNLQANIGAGWNRYDGDHFGEVIWMRHMGLHEKGDQWYLNNGDKKDFNTFAKINFATGSRLNWMADVQYRTINYALSGEDDDNAPIQMQRKYHFFNPKAGVFFQINPNNQAFASFAISNREPTRTNFKDAKGDEHATPLPERLFDYEAGYYFSATRFSLKANLFYMYYHNQLIPTGAKSDVGYDIMTNVAKSYRAGIELSWGLPITQWLNWDANLTWSQNKIKDFVLQGSIMDENWEETGTTVQYHLGTTHLAYSPNVVGSSILAFKPFRSAKINFISKYVGEQYFDNTSNAERKLDDYLVHQLQLQYALFPQRMKRIDFQLTINNLLNLQYENNAYGGPSFIQEGSEISQYTWAYYYPQAGTHFVGKITLSF